MKLFVDNLTNVDFSYLDAKRGLLGESWLVELELDGSLNEQGMICDFGIVKKQVKQWFDSTIDHALVIPELMDSLTYREQDTQMHHTPSQQHVHPWAWCWAPRHGHYHDNPYIRILPPAV